jgi:lipopolysaccharide/colanic/teichoic acid biosynthesis glycosyltransferase
MLQAERMRSDRSGIKFCLVTFTLDGKKTEQIERLVSHINGRLRATDAVGLISENEIGVILWDTLEPGAKSYVKEIRAHEAADCILSATLYLYPQTGTEIGSLAASADGEECARHAQDAGALRSEALEILFIQKLPSWKRALDIVGASAGLIALSPLLLATAILIKLTSKGPVLFKQERDGLGGKRFIIYKFRTMRADAERLKDQLRAQSEQDGPAFKLTNDPRITSIGRYLRKTCIDELPQLWNVLKGDMTLVGPRPLDSKEAAKISVWGKRRAEVTPGLTCIWQVYGKSKVTFNEWMRMDIRYMNRRTLRGDFRLIWETLVAVVRHRASV